MYIVYLVTVCLTVRMGLEPILSAKQTITVYKMLNLDGNGDDKEMKTVRVNRPLELESESVSVQCEKLCMVQCSHLFSSSNYNRYPNQAM